MTSTHVRLRRLLSARFLLSSGYCFYTLVCHPSFVQGHGSRASIPQAQQRIHFHAVSEGSEDSSPERRLGCIHRLTPRNALTVHWFVRSLVKQEDWTQRSCSSKARLPPRHSGGGKSGLDIASVFAIPVYALCGMCGCTFWTSTVAMIMTHVCIRCKPAHYFHSCVASPFVHLDCYPCSSCFQSFGNLGHDSSPI